MQVTENEHEVYFLFVPTGAQEGLSCIFLMFYNKYFIALFSLALVGMFSIPMMNGANHGGARVHGRETGGTASSTMAKPPTVQQPTSMTQTGVAPTNALPPPTAATTVVNPGGAATYAGYVNALGTMPGGVPMVQHGAPPSYVTGMR